MHVRLSGLWFLFHAAGRRPAPRVTRNESLTFCSIKLSHRIVGQLSLYHDSLFSAFSTEVFDRMNQKHNRSSYPFTTLAKQAERKVVITVAGQPNY